MNNLKLMSNPIIDRTTIYSATVMIAISLCSGISEAALFYTLYLVLSGEENLSIITDVPVLQIFFVLMILTTILRILSLFLGAHFPRVISNRLVAKVLIAYNATEYTFKKLSDMSDLLSILLNRIGSIQSHLIQTVITGFSALLQTCFTLLVIIYVSDVNLMGLTTVILAYAFIMLFIYFKAKTIGNKVTTMTSQHFDHVKNYVSNIKYFLIRDQLENKSADIISYDNELRRLGAQILIMNGIPKIIIELSIFSLLLIFLSSELNTADTANLPNLILILTAILRIQPLLQVVYSSFVTFVSAVPNYKHSLEKLLLYQKFAAVVSTERLSDFHSLCMENIDICYEERKILKNVNFQLKKGDKVIILGPSGSGKSTLVEAICGLIQPRGGEIYYNNERIFSLNNATWRKEITYLDQDGTIAGRTLREVFGVNRQNNVTETKVADLLHSLELKSLSTGRGFLDKDYGENLATLSGGQRARVKIGTGLIKDSEILILDETLANVDDETDTVVLDLLKKIPRTIILISHKPIHTSSFRVLFDCTLPRVSVS